MAVFYHLRETQPCSHQTPWKHSQQNRMDRLEGKTACKFSGNPKKEKWKFFVQWDSQFRSTCRWDNLLRILCAIVWFPCQWLQMCRLNMLLTHETLTISLFWKPFDFICFQLALRFAHLGSHWMRRAIEWQTNWEGNGKLCCTYSLAKPCFLQFKERSIKFE